MSLFKNDACLRNKEEMYDISGYVELYRHILRMTREESDE